MVRVENECCDCATESYPCLGSSCPNLHVTHYYCDRCGDDTTLYHFDGEELCIECIKKELEEVE